MTTFLASFIVLAIGGIFTAGYLVWQHRQKQNKPLICPLNHDCSAVTESKWSKIFLIRNEILGLLFYLGMFGLGLGLLFFPGSEETFRFLMRVGTSIALLFSLFLVYLQARVIKNYCFYCLISALITLLLWVNAWVI